MIQTDNEPVMAYFDGCCDPVNPGGYACGGWLTIGHPQCPPISGHRFYCRGEKATNNVAEYEAALDCLRAIYRAGYRGPVRLHGDSMLVVRQFNRSFGCYKPHLQILLAKLHKAESLFEELQLVWIPREENTDADTLSRQAYHEASGQKSKVWRR